MDSFVQTDRRKERGGREERRRRIGGPEEMKRKSPEDGGVEGNA